MSRKGIITLISVLLGCITLGAIVYGVYSNFKVTPIKDETETHYGRVDSISDDSDVEAFTEIKVNTEVAAVNVSVGDSYNVSYLCSSNRVNDIIPTVGVKNGVLTITQNIPNRISVGVNDRECRIDITVPKGTKLGKVDISTDVGDVEFRGINCDNIKAESDVGAVNIADLETESIDITSSVGSLYIGKVTCKTVMASSEVGEVEIVNSTIDKVTASSNIGDVTASNVKNSNGGKPEYDVFTSLGKEHID